MDAGERFAKLRGLLGCGPSLGLWKRICALFDGWPQEPRKEHAFDYARAHLAGWDASLCMGSLSVWWPSFPREKPQESWRLVRSLSINDTDLERLRGSEKKVAWEEDFGHIDGLQIRLQFPHEAGFAALLSLPWVRQLQILDIVCPRFGPEGARMVAEVDFSNLQRLKMEHTDLGPNGIAVLCGSPALASLQELSLSNNGLSSQALWSLLEGLEEASLRALSLNYNDIDDEGIEELCRASVVSGLLRLTLQANRFGLEGCDALLQREWEALQDLDLSFNALGPELEDVFSQAQRGYRLQALGLSGVALAEGVRRLGQASILRSLRHLELAKNGLSDEDLVALLEAPFVPCLEFLDLRDNRIGNAGASALAQTTGWDALKVLKIGRNTITSKGISAILRSRTLRSLQGLELEKMRSF